MLQEQNAIVWHPRPQLTREAWANLGGAWGFAFDDATQGLDARWYERDDVYTRTIQVPFPPESSASGIGETGFHPVVWYRRTFELPEAYRGKRIIFHCGAVDYRARVWVNGQLVATHEGGHTPFSADITTALTAHGAQVVVIRAEDLPFDLAQPRGKQDWEAESHGIWYNRTTGIWQPVWYEAVAAEAHVAKLRWTPDVDRSQLGMELTLQRHDATPLQVRVQLRLHDKELCDDLYMVQETELQRHIALALNDKTRSDLFWSPEHPNLIDATITLLSAGEVIDEVGSYVGFRSVGTAGGHFMLNGRPYYLRFALEQGYWPQSHLAAPSDEALRREVELIKELGLNGVRIHQKIEDPRFLYWCDHLGVLVWGEIANAYVYSQSAVERLTREWLEALERDYSHPCIVAWVPVNESWGVPNLPHSEAQRHYVQALYHLTKALDPTRPVISNDGWEHMESDIYSIHDYAFDGKVIAERYGDAEAVVRTVAHGRPSGRSITLGGAPYNEQPVMLTEFGGLSYRPKAGENWFGYGTVSSQQDYINKYRELIEAVLACPTVAGFCYTQLTDTLQETNGLLTEDREPKLDIETLREINTRKR
ncbi:MAG TPA: glycoside hydrolase family 2 TIM barrel-domain containing protein [Ktedonobacteraceae bacterium]|jgi:beta-galactosidase/beta-glucuronidase|nr:glycoside hydrolase family 2 TIM barrel-domain containing protein [Ktedonobacteraceae bacterium]